MTSKLPPAVTAFLNALRSRNSVALMETFARDATVVDGATGCQTGVREWAGRAFSGAALVHPIGATRSSGGATVVVAVKPSGEGEVAQQSWRVTVRDAKISGLTTDSADLPRMPAAVASFVMATNTFDLARLLDSFSDDAVVNDQFREYSGKIAIRDWAERDIVGNRMTMHVVNAVERASTVIVVANVDGDFDKEGLPDPLRLSFYFTLHADRILQLIILRNEPTI